jgi:hypothetical protein
MRLHRARKRSGLRCLTLEIRETEIAALIRNGLLSPDSGQDSTAIRSAIYALLDRHLGGGIRYVTGQIRVPWSGISSRFHASKGLTTSHGFTDIFESVPGRTFWDSQRKKGTH